VIVEWNPPKEAGGLPPKNYILEVREKSRTNWNQVAKVDASITSYCVQKLTENIEYLFRVSSENSAGISEALVMDEYVKIKSPFGKSWLNMKFLLLLVENVET